MWDTPDIYALAKRWLTEALEELEERLSAMDGYQEDEGYDLALTDALESTGVQLMNNDFSTIQSEVDGLLKSERLAGLRRNCIGVCAGK